MIKSRQILPLDKRHTGEVKPPDADPYSDKSIQLIRDWVYKYQSALVEAKKQLVEFKPHIFRFEVHVPNFWKVWTSPEAAAKPSQVNFDKWANCLKNYKMALKVAEQQIEELLDRKNERSTTQENIKKDR